MAPAQKRAAHFLSGLTEVLGQTPSALRGKVGICVGGIVGGGDGGSVGRSVGGSDGGNVNSVGGGVGSGVGADVGFFVGFLVGVVVGCAVGDGVGGAGGPPAVQTMSSACDLGHSCQSMYHGNSVNSSHLISESSWLSWCCC